MFHLCFREKSAEMEVELMKLQQEKDVLEARIEQRHLQVSKLIDNLANEALIR